MAKPSSTHPTQQKIAKGTQNGSDRLTKEQTQVLNGYVQRLQKTAGEDLQIRHELGRWLNTQYGSPGQNQRRHQKVILLVAKELGISVSEVYRLRDFGFYVKKFTTFIKKHPNYSWCKVKQILPELKGSSPKVAGQVQKRAPRRVNTIKRSVRGVCNKLESFSKSEPTQEESTELLAIFKQLGEAVRSTLSITLTIQMKRRK